MAKLSVRGRGRLAEIPRDIGVTPYTLPCHPLVTLSPLLPGVAQPAACLPRKKRTHFHALIGPPTPRGTDIALARAHKIMSASTRVGQSATTSSLKSGSTGVDDVQLSYVSGILAGPTRRTTLPAEGDTWQPGDGYHGQANLEAKLDAANGSEASHVPASCSSRRDNECLGGTSRASLVAANASLVGTYEPPSLHS